MKTVYAKGKKFRTKYFTVFFLSSEKFKYSIVVSKKISKKAVVRNRIKRRIRTICKKLLNSGQYIVLVKTDVSEIEFKILENDFKKIL